MVDFVVKPASGIEFEFVPGLELAAAKMLDPADLLPAIAAMTTSTEEAKAAQQEGRLIVARTSEGKVVGFALLAELDGHTHLEELDVAPEYGLRGRARGRRRRNLQAIGSDSLGRAGTRLDSERPKLAAEAWVATRPSTSIVVLSRIPRLGSECTTPRVGREKKCARTGSSHRLCEGRGSQSGRKMGARSSKSAP